MFLYGGVGLGKTHLMHAVAWNIKKRNPKKNVVYLTAEKFMYQFIKALRFKNIMSFTYDCICRDSRINDNNETFIICKIKDPIIVRSSELEQHEDEFNDFVDNLNKCQKKKVIVN